VGAESYARFLDPGRAARGIGHMGKVPQNDPGLPLVRMRGYAPVIVYGAGRGAVTIKECLDLGDSYRVACFVDDAPEHPLVLCEVPVYHSSRVEEIIQEGILCMACGVAARYFRLKLLERCKELGIDLVNVIHPKTFISPSAKIGQGNYIKAGAMIETNTVIGDCCIIDNGAVIAHDNIIGDGCHIAPGVSMGSSIQVGRLTLIGIGASVATGTRIGRSVIVSTGSSVVEDVPDFAHVEGVPARVVGKKRFAGTGEKGQPT